MQMHVHADPELKPGSAVYTVGNTRHPIVVETIGPSFRATSEDADVWGLQRGCHYQVVTGRDLAREERLAFDFSENPTQALYWLVSRQGQAHAGGDGNLLHLANLSRDVFSGTQNLHADGELLVATSYTHIYDGKDIRKASALTLSDLPAEYRAHAEQLVARAQEAAAQQDDDEEWETL